MRATTASQSSDARANAPPPSVGPRESPATSPEPSFILRARRARRRSLRSEALWPYGEFVGGVNGGVASLVIRRLLLRCSPPGLRRACHGKRAHARSRRLP